MSGFAIAGIAVAIGTTAYGAIQQNKASKKAAAADTQTANYNAQVDTAQAQQIQLDTEANIQTEQQDDAVYLSRQAASYAASGVISNTGSPLHAQITTAGRLNQRIQQQYSDSQRKQQLLYAQAQEGVYYGQAEASADNAVGTAALLTGGAKIAGLAFDAYNSGVFSGGSGGDGENFSVDSIDTKK